MQKNILVMTIFFIMTIFHPMVYALAMAEIKLNSSLNQSLDAVIDLSAANDELESLNVSVSRLARDTSGLQRWPGIMVRLVREENGRNYIKITSKDPIREPVLNFLLELDWSKGRIKREYSLLIDI